MPDLITFRQKMNMYDKESLKAFAGDLLIKQTYKLNKADLIERIAETILEPKALFDRMAILDDRAMKLLEKASMERIELDIDDADTYDLACTLNELDLADLGRFGQFSTLSDVWDVYKNEIAGEEFEAYRKKASWVWRCLHWAEYMYVYAPMDVMVRVINNKKGMHLTEEEITDIYRRYTNDRLHMIQYKDVFIYSIYIGNKDVLERLRRAQADKPYYIPTEAEVDEFFVSNALISKKSYQDMKAFLMKDMELDEHEATSLLYDLWDKICEDDDPHGTMQWFWDQFQFKDDKQVNKIVGLYMSLCNDTNLLVNRGHAPSDMPRPKLKPGQMPTIVPGSSHAAKMLAEAAPHIRQMGFGVDIEGNSRELPVFGMPAGMNGPVVETTKKVYPNDPCPCGSGKKFKKCCGRN